MLSSKLHQPAPKVHVIGAAVFAGFLCFLLYSGQYKPKAKRVTELEAEIVEVNQEVKTLEEFNAKVKETRDKHIQEISSQVQKSANDDPRLQLIRKSRAPEFRLFEDFMRRIMNPNFRSSVDVQTLNYQARIEYSGFSETEFEISASGPFANVMSFLSRVEKMPALMTIKDFDLQVGKTDNAFVIVSIKASFYQLEDDNVWERAWI